MRRWATGSPLLGLVACLACLPQNQLEAPGPIPALPSAVLVLDCDGRVEAYAWDEATPGPPPALCSSAPAVALLRYESPLEDLGLSPGLMHSTDCTLDRAVEDCCIPTQLPPPAVLMTQEDNGFAVAADVPELVEQFRFARSCQCHDLEILSIDAFPFETVRLAPWDDAYFMAMATRQDDTSKVTALYLVDASDPPGRLLDLEPELRFEGLYAPDFHVSADQEIFIVQSSTSALLRGRLDSGFGPEPTPADVRPSRIGGSRDHGPTQLIAELSRRPDEVLVFDEGRWQVLTGARSSESCFIPSTMNVQEGGALWSERDEMLAWPAGDDRASDERGRPSGHWRYHAGQLDWVPWDPARGCLTGIAQVEGYGLLFGTSSGRVFVQDADRADPRELSYRDAPALAPTGPTFTTDDITGLERFPGGLGLVDHRSNLAVFDGELLCTFEPLSGTSFDSSMRVGDSLVAAGSPASGHDYSQIHVIRSAGPRAP